MQHCSLCEQQAVYADACKCVQCVGVCEKLHCLRCLAATNHTRFAARKSQKRWRGA